MKTLTIFWLDSFLKNLSKQEKLKVKNHFKLKNKQEYKVIDLLDKSVTFQDRLLYRKIEKIGFAKPHLLCKSLLNNAVKALKNFYPSVCQENSVLEDIQIIKFLSKKKLYALAKQKLEKLKTHVIKNEQFSYLQIILNEELVLLKYIPKELNKRGDILLEMGFDSQSLTRMDVYHSGSGRLRDVWISSCMKERTLTSGLISLFMN